MKNKKKKNFKYMFEKIKDMARLVRLKILVLKNI